MVRAGARTAGLLAMLETVRALYPSDILQCQGGYPAQTTERMTTCLYDQIANAVVSTWSALSTTCTEEECQQAEWAGCVLRLSGHDFMDFKDGSGGSDGCADLDADDNKGLAACLYDGQFGMSINQAYQPFCQTVSLADFIVVAGEAMMMATRRNADGPPLDFSQSFKFGRTTMKECPSAGANLPNPEGSCSEVDRVFLQNLGLDWRGAAALSGAHTIGRARAANSGYDGWWTGPKHARSFDNMYFVALLLRGWSPNKGVNGDVGKNQWRRSDGERDMAQHEMMLNTDLCLAYDNNRQSDGVPGAMLSAATTDCCAWVVPTEVEAARAHGHHYCGAQTLPPGFIAQRALCCDNNPGALDCNAPIGRGGEAYAHVKQFALDDNAWIEAFKAAWKKATENGFESSLKELEPCDGTTPKPGIVNFDCAAGESNWKKGWSELKKGFCCRNAGVGCEENFDCSAGVANWQQGWSPSKKYHCCQETGVSCAGLFDCSIGVANWEVGWSALKRMHCCQSDNIGCSAVSGLQQQYDADADAELLDDGEQEESSAGSAEGFSVQFLGGLAGTALGLLALRAVLSSRKSADQSESSAFEPEGLSE